jgi:hypothetical protein
MKLLIIFYFNSFFVVSIEAMQVWIWVVMARLRSFGYSIFLPINYDLYSFIVFNFM